jgi:hypothetical protein
MIVLFTANLYLAAGVSDDELPLDSEIRALRMELMMALFQSCVCAWSYVLEVDRAESQASLQICFRRLGGIGWVDVRIYEVWTYGKESLLNSLPSCQGSSIVVCTENGNLVV